MAIFSIMHFFAFPWKPYALASSSLRHEASYQPGSGTDLESPHSKSPPAKYVGGFLGIKALADAFNPWDILKATARGLRWLFVGRRNRFQDTSYSSQMNAQSKPLASEHRTDTVPMYAKMSSTNPTSNSAQPHDSDTAGLLSNAGTAAPSHRPAADDPETGVIHPPAGDLGMAGSSSPYYSANPHQLHPSSPSQNHTPYRNSQQPPPVIRISPSDGFAPPPTNSVGETTMPTAGTYGGRDHDEMYNTQGYFNPSQSGLDASADTGYHGRASIEEPNNGIGMAYGGHTGEPRWDERHHGDRY